MSRYARQMVLPEVGAGGQARLGAAHALVVGAGGLGVPVLQYLAGAGLGHITVIDPDGVERGNLHRQPIYGERSMGRPKVEAAAKVLADLNPEVSVTPIVAALDPVNAPDLVSGADVVLDCADSFAASYVLSDVCLAANKPFVTASALGLGGYAGGFCAGAPSLRAVFPDLPERTANCATAGVLGPVVGLLGAMQAQIALAILLGMEPSPLGQVVSFEAAGLRFSGFRFDGAPEPERPLRFLAPSEIGLDDFVIDLRPPEEAPVPAAAHARRALVDTVAHGELPEPGQRTVLACRTGLRSWAAARRLERVWDGPILLVAMGDPQPAMESA